MFPEPTALPRISINLEYGDSEHAACREVPLARYRNYTTKRYSQQSAPLPSYVGHGIAEVNLSVLRVPQDIEKEWWGTPESYWMRQKIRRAQRCGYHVSTFDFQDHVEDIFTVNTSKPERQGRAMAQWYRHRPPAVEPFGDQPCTRHRNDYLGVFRDGRLYAYALVLQSGEMMLFSQLIEHAEHLEDGVMNLLVYEAVSQVGAHPCYAVYHLQHNGSAGLQFFKRKMGFRGHCVRWELARPGVAVPRVDLTPVEIHHLQWT